MPVKGKKKEVKNVKYESIADFYRNIDDYKTLDGKLDYATKYILAHGNDPRHDYALSGVVHLARMRIAEAVNRNPGKLETYKKAQMFLGNPSAYIKAEGKKLSKEIDEANINLPGEDTFKENADRVIEAMDEQFNTDVFTVDEVSKSIGVKSRIEAAFGSRARLEQNFKETKGTWFSKLFNTGSKQWDRLEDAYQDFNNPHAEKYGDFDHLNNAAIAYLQHKYPKWNPKDPLPDDAFANLNRSESAKVNFSIAVINSVKEQSKINDKFHEMVDESKARDIKYEDLPEKEENVIDLEQLEFQNKLKNDVNIEDNTIEDYLEDSKDLSVEKDDVLDEYALDDSLDSNNSI